MQFSTTKRVGAALALLLAVPAALPAGAQAPVAMFFDDFQTDNGWATTASDDFNGWQLYADGNNDAAAWYAGLTSDPASPGSPQARPGYGPNADVRLTSPLINGTGFVPTGVSYSVKGGSELGFDFLNVFAKARPQQSWLLIDRISGNGGTAFSTRTIAQENLEFLVDDDFQLRFQFRSNGGCDAVTYWECSAESGQPAEGSTPGGFPGGTASNTTVGWTIDDVRVVGTAFVESTPTAPALPQPTTIKTFTIAQGATGAPAVDIVADAGGVIEFVVNETTFAPSTPANSVVIDMRTGPTDNIAFRTTLSLEETTVGNDTYRVWTGRFNIDQAKFVAGAWSVSAKATTRVGAVTELAATSMTVAASPVPAKATISLGGVTKSPPPTQYLAAGDRLRFVVTHDLLQKVTYQVTTMDGNQSAKGPELRLPSPYVVSAAQLGEGTHEVKVRAYDRSRPAFDAASPSVVAFNTKAIVDLNAPVVTVNQTGPIYQGVPYSFNVTVRDHSNHTVYVQINQTTSYASSSTRPEQNHTIVDTRDALGLVPVRIVVIDRVGHQSTQTVFFTVEEAIADTVAQALEKTGGVALAGKAIEFRATIEQRGGVVAVPVTVHFSGSAAPIRGFGEATGCAVTAQNATLAINGSAVLSYCGSFAPGRHVLSVNVSVAPGVVEVNATNQELDIPFEVFVGSSKLEGKTYYIRGNDLGLPDVAVDVENNKLYRLQLKSQGEGSIYEFQVGSATGYWDPTKQETVVLEEATPAEVGEKSPGAPLVLLVLSLVGLAIARRRK